MASQRHAVPDGVTCAALVDALGRRYAHRSDITDLVSPTPGRVLFGPAVTIAYVPYREDLYDPDRHSFASLFYRAVGEAPEGKVLVLSSGGYPDTSHGGGTKLYRAETHRLAGILADGRLRDFDEFGRCDLATYCRGEATRAGGDTVMPFAAGVAVEFGGVTIAPGDYIYADASGAVVVPAGDLDKVLDSAREIEAEDAAARARILGEEAGDARAGAGEV